MKHLFGDKLVQTIEDIKRTSDACRVLTGKNLCLAFSGGKDSVVCHHLLTRSGIAFDNWNEEE